MGTESTYVERTGGRGCSQYVGVMAIVRGYEDLFLGLSRLLVSDFHPWAVCGCVMVYGSVAGFFRDGGEGC